MCGPQLVGSRAQSLGRQLASEGGRGQHDPSTTEAFHFVDFLLSSLGTSDRGAGGAADDDTERGMREQRVG